MLFTTIKLLIAAKLGKFLPSVLRYFRMIDADYQPTSYLKTCDMNLKHSQRPKTGSLAAIAALTGFFAYLLVFSTPIAFADESTEPAAPAEVETESDTSLQDYLDDVNTKLNQFDDYVGEKVVKPMEAVIFSGLWSADYEEAQFDDAGQAIIDPETKEQVILPREGWLGDGSVSVPFIVIWLLVGAIFFTLFMGFINVRGFWHAIRLTRGDYDDPDDHGEVSHFQALSSALSGTVGLGNIAGVAIAIGQGGPGATFWMILVGLLGMSTKFTECTLGQMYRTVDSKGQVRGGPMRYLSVGLKEKGLGPLGSVLAVLFAILCIGGSFGGGNTFQISQSLDVIRTEAPIINQYSYLYGLIMVFAVGLVIIGGIKSIGKVASRIVPFMCLGYVACVLYILYNNLNAIPSAFQSIWDGAFNFEAGYGAFLGCLVIGIKRLSLIHI